jgi:indole-3-glycerol phosphate synthase
MASLLDQIIVATRRRVAQARQSADIRELERRAAEHRVRGFRRRLQEKAESGVAVIAELKKASPSRNLAVELEGAGAAALSVLTDEAHFDGSLENLRRASAATAVPCLRKDFIVDEFQLLEARAHCADAVLLIVAALEKEDLTRLAAKAQDAGLDVLCEVHNAEELRRAVDAGCDLIGVNNRDLQTFKVDLGTALRLAVQMPGHVVRVAESGIHSAAEIARLRDAGFHAFLIGESLMTAEHPGEALKVLLRAEN